MGTSVTRSEANLHTQNCPWTLLWAPGCCPALPSTPCSYPGTGPVPSPGVLCPCRWLGYLGLLLLDVAICLLVLVGLIRSSKGILVG